MNESHIIPVGHEPPPIKPTAKAVEKSAAAAKRDAAGRFAVLNGFVDAGMAGLGRAELATWLVLYRDTRNGTARTSAGDIARRGGLSRRAVVNALAGLRRRRLVTLVYRGGLNRGASVYRIHAVPP